MLSAPETIPAMIEVTSPAGFVPAEATRGATEARVTFWATSFESPACSANAITGTRPASDTRLSSSNKGVALDHACDSFTSSALSVRSDQDVDTPDSSAPQGTLTFGAPYQLRSRQALPRIQAKVEITAHHLQACPSIDWWERRAPKERRTRWRQ